MAGQRSLFELSLDTGLSSGSRVHDHIVQLYAMTPGQVQTQGDGIVISHGFYASPFGECHIASTDKGVCWLSFISPSSREDSIKQLNDEWPNAKFAVDQGAHSALIKSLFDAGAVRQPLFLHVKGSNFQLKVWEALLNIPAGSCCRYQDIAQQVDSPRAARAVGTAIGQNPISWLIPCHRVIRGTGVVGHYRWGSVRKQSLLLWEQGQHSGA
jgi:AraC family transcriptional regulator of adaptative response/methylated-DNA-[protein]-cysteine methyltransferase